VPTGSQGLLLAGELAHEGDDLDEAERLLAAALVHDDEFSSSRVLSLRIRIAATRRAVDEDLLTQLAEAIAAHRYGQESIADYWHHALVLSLHAGLKPARALELCDIAGPAAVPAPDSHSADPRWPAHLAGALAEAAGDHEAAAAWYSEAVSDRAWRRSVPAEADARLGAARSLLALGHTRDALAPASAAAALLEKWPGWRQREAHALLRRLRATEPALETPSGLTGREEEVGRLVAEGLTNGEIAARLFISTKTASVHVSNILRKLDLANRAELAAWVVEHRS
jgi:DNA-binding CsgD family transcriptional regulator